MGATRVANRTKTDELVEFLLQASTERVSTTQLLEQTGWTRTFLRQECLYLAHCYGALKEGYAGIFWTVIETGVIAYLDGSQNRQVCNCGTGCHGAGERER